MPNRNETEDFIGKLGQYLPTMKPPSQLPEHVIPYPKLVFNVEKDSKKSTVELACLIMVLNINTDCMQKHLDSLLLQVLSISYAQPLKIIRLEIHLFSCTNAFFIAFSSSGQCHTTTLISGSSKVRTAGDLVTM